MGRSDAAAAGAIDTDGPDFVESSETVGHGRFQFEANLAAERDVRRAINRLSTPTLLRLGAAETFEVRIETSDRIRVRDNLHSASTPEAAETAIGLKWHAQDREPASGVPAVAWIFHLAAPALGAALRGVGVRPSLRSVITWDLPGDWSLGLMPGVVGDTNAAGQRSASGVFGGVLGKRVSSEWRVFAEIAAPRIARAGDGGVLLTWNLGAAYLLADDWQIGLRAARAANLNTPGRALLLAVAGRF